MRSSRVFSVLSRFPHAPCVASSRGVCLILPDQPLFTSHLRRYRTHLNVPDRGIYGYAAGLLHAATKQHVPDGQISIDQDALGSSHGRACPASWVFPRAGRYCFNLIITTLQAGLVPVEAFSAPLLQSGKTVHLLHLSGDLSTIVCFKPLRLGDPNSELRNTVASNRNQHLSVSSLLLTSARPSLMPMCR